MGTLQTCCRASEQAGCGGRGEGWAHGEERAHLVGYLAAHPQPTHLPFCFLNASVKDSLAERQEGTVFGESSGVHWNLGGVLEVSISWVGFPEQCFW